jgi:hypothetical protein
MPAWTSYDQNNLIYKALVEIGDWPTPSYRFASDAELRGYLDEWQDLVQEEFQLVRSTATLALGSGTSTFAVSSLASDLLTLEDTCWITGTSTSLLAPQSPEALWELQQSNPAGLSSPGGPPVVIYPITYGTFGVWPTPSTAGTLHSEYIPQLRYAAGTNTSGLPSWMREMPTPYIAARVFGKFSAIQDLPRASVYRQHHSHNMGVVRKLLDLQLPLAASGRLRPGRGAQAQLNIPRRSNLR